jgi:hypothetical protein
MKHGPTGGTKKVESAKLPEDVTSHTK